MRQGTTYGRSRIRIVPISERVLRGHRGTRSHGRDGARAKKNVNVASVQLGGYSGREGKHVGKVCRGGGWKKEETNASRVSFVRVRRCIHTRARRLLELFRARLCTLDDSYFNFLFAN